MDLATLAERVERLKREGGTWNEIGRALGIKGSQARSLWRRTYGDRRATGRTPLENALLDQAAQVHGNGQVAELVESLNPAQPAWGGVPYEQAQGLDVDEWIDFLERLQVKHNELDPIVTQAERVIETDRPIAIQFVSCWHLGSRFVEYRGFKENLGRLKALPGFYWGIHGDEFDNFGSGFPSAEAMWSQLIPPRFQRELVRAILQDLGDQRKAMYACWSNHPGFDERKLGENLIKGIYRQAGIPYFDGKGVLTLKVGEVSYRLYVAHQFSGTSQWSKNFGQMKALFMEMPSADVVVMGDKHSAGLQKVYHHVQEFDVGNRKAPYTWLVQTGTAKAGPDQYSIRNWTRGVFEWPTLVFDPHKHSIKLVDDLDDLEHFLK